jgi:hypothetical protein
MTIADRHLGCMHDIVNLFRSRQRDAAPFDPPFTVEQLAVMA